MTRNAGRHGWTRAGAMGRASLIGCVAMVLLVGAGCEGSGRRTGQPIAGLPTDLQIQEARRLAMQAQQADKQGNTERAISLYQEAVRTYGSFGPWWHNLGVLLSESGNRLAAREALARAAELSPTDPRPRYMLGVLYERTNYYDDASKYYKRALEADATYLPALRRMVYIDSFRDDMTEEANERMRTYMLVEKDEELLERFAWRRLQLEQAKRDRERDMIPTGMGMRRDGFRPAPPPPTTPPTSTPDSFDE